MKSILISACAAALLLSAGAASAQSQRGPRIDADQDGRISQAEFMSRLDRRAAFDTDRDGSITPDERRAAVLARVAQRRDVVFDRLDANDDGAVTRDEFSARPENAPRARMARQHMRRMAHRGGARAAARANHTVDLAQVRERMSQTFARLDKDGDGYLTVEERRDGRMERREHRREMRRPSAPASE